MSTGELMELIDKGACLGYLRTTRSYRGPITSYGKQRRPSDDLSSEDLLCLDELKWALGSSYEEASWLITHDLAKERQGVTARDFDDVLVGIASSDKPSYNVLTFCGGIDSSDES